MHLIDRCASELPNLRRYARALTGDQRLGDDIVEAVFREIANGGIDAFDPDGVKVDLYRAVQSRASALGPSGLSSQGAASETVADQRLQAMSFESRSAFLLSAMEGLSIDDVANVHRVSQTEIEDWLRLAKRQIEGQLSAKLLIIEDEPLIAAHLRSIVSGMGHEVVGTATTRDEAVGIAGKTSPDLILADVQLADLSSGIAAVDDILPNASAAVIFITAFPERLLTGKRPEPAFLIPKPFEDDMVRAVISQALFFSQVNLD